MMASRWIALALLALTAGAHAAEKEKWVTLSHPQKGGPVYHLAGSKAAFFYRTFDFSTDYDGSPKAYHPKGKNGGALDYTANAGKTGNWYGIVTTNGKKNGTPAIQKAGDPAPGFYVSPSALADRSKKPADPHRYVDAATVPYASLPPNVQNIKGGNKDGANQGDFGTAVNLKTGKAVHFIVADSGPRNKIGEGSLALRKALGLKGATDMVWIVYPRTKHSPPWPVSAGDINSEGAKHFQAFGGVAKAKALFPGKSK
jgi:hypothetical protein